MDESMIVTAFLEGMYYAGKLPSRGESYAIAGWLTKHQLKGRKPIDVEKLVLDQMAVLHERVTPPSKNKHNSTDSSILSVESTDAREEA